MKCPRDNARCAKFNTVRRCPGCPVWAQAKEARREREAQAMEARRIAQLRQSAEMPQPEAQAQATLIRPSSSDALHTETEVLYAEASYAGMPTQTDGVYRYDGSLDGLLCCLQESLDFQALPVSIEPMADAQPTLTQSKDIPSDQARARRMRSFIVRHITGDGMDLIETVYFSCLRQKEMRILRFLWLGLREGPKAMGMLGHPDMAPLLAAERHLLREAHLLKGFIRFSDYDGVLAANITPKNFILPFLANHFCARYAEESFVIYDKNHKAALLYENRKRSIVRLEEMPFPEADAQEELYRAMWKRFYHTIAIEARTNPRCRMTNMPKRYWENMTEMKELL